MIKTVRRLIVVAIVGVVAAMAVISAKDYSEYNTHRNVINEQTKKIAEVTVEKDALKEEIKEAGEELAALPDSQRVASAGIAMRKSWSFGKREQQLDGFEERAVNLIRSREKKQRLVVQHAMKWNVPLAIVAVLLGVTFFILKRTAP